jgi:hypothetical protein
VASRIEDERGAVLPIVGLLIVVLIVFAAFTVDLGAAWSQQTRNQSAADAGVLAGAVGVLDGEGSNPLIIANVMDFVDSNLDPDVLASEWSACTDPEVDNGNFAPLDGSVTACISLSVGTESRSRILRVNLPERNVETSFAKVIGVDTLATSGFAEAEVFQAEGGGVLPFVVPSDNSLEYCIGDVPGGLANDPCDGPQRGKFGDVDSPFEGTVDPGTDACPGDPNLNTRLAWNAAIGLDHIVIEAGGNDAAAGWSPAAGADICDAFLPDPDGWFPYALKLGNGNPQPSALTAGFAGDGPFGTTAALPGRLRQGGGITGDERPVPSGNGTVALDNVGLWEYLTRTGTPGNPDDANNKCDGNHPDYHPALPDLYDPTTTMSQCLQSGDPDFNYGGADSDAILSSPRFALIPRLWLNQAQLDGAGPGTFHNIKEFVPAYVQTTFWNCSAVDCMAFERFDDATPGDPSDDPRFFSPGMGDVEGCVIQGNGCKNNVHLALVGVTAFVLDRGDVPPQAFGGGPDAEDALFVLLHR